MQRDIDIDIVRATRPLGFPWETADPFLFCVHADGRIKRPNALGVGHR